MTKDGSKTRGGHPTRARVEEINAALMTATIAAIVEFGIDFTIDQVAALAGVSKQAIYRRWQTRSEMVLHVLDAAVRQDVAETRAGLPDDPLEALRYLAMRDFEKDGEKRFHVQAFIQVEAMRNPAVARQAMGWYDQGKALVLEQLAALDRDGRRFPGDMNLQADLLLQMQGGLATRLALDSVGETERKQAFARWWQLYCRTILA